MEIRDRPLLIPAKVLKLSRRFEVKVARCGVTSADCGTRRSDPGLEVENPGLGVD